MGAINFDGVTFEGGITIIPPPTTKPYLVATYAGLPIPPESIGTNSSNGYFYYDSTQAQFDSSGPVPNFSDVQVGWLVNGPGVINQPVVVLTPGTNYVSFGGGFGSAQFTIGEYYTFTDPNQ